MAKMIERNTTTGDYDLPKREMIVEMSDGRRVYLVEGFGGVESLEGGMYRWRHGLAIQVLPTDTIDSLHEEFVEFDGYGHMMGGYDKQRPMLAWDGDVINRVATSATEPK